MNELATCARFVQKFSEAVFEVASSDLVHMGMSVVSYTIKDISDDAGYLAALGMTRTAQVRLLLSSPLLSSPLLSSHSSICLHAHYLS